MNRNTDERALRQILVIVSTLCLILGANVINCFSVSNPSRSLHVRDQFSSIGEIVSSYRSKMTFEVRTNEHSNTVLNAMNDDEVEEEYEDEEEDDDDGEWEYEYEYEEGDEEEEYDEEEEEEEEDVDDEEMDDLEPLDSFNIPLQDDPDDPLYTEQKRIVEENAAESKAFDDAKKVLSISEEVPDFVRNNLDEFLDEKLAEAGVDMKEVDEKLAMMEISEADAEKAIQEHEERTRGMSKTEKASAFIRNLGSDADAFPPDDDPIYKTGEDNEVLGVKNEDLVKLQKALEELVGTIEGFTDGSLVKNKQAMIRPNLELEQLDHETFDEINMCLNASAVNANGQEYAETIKNEDPVRWLLYDLNFNVTNLMLAACKYNPEAPLLLNHWMPQLCAYSRYADVRERDFQFTWDDCDNADMDEFFNYFKGLGYDEVPTFSSKETNIIEVESEYDQEDITMSAFENWMDEVYNEENEDLYFDDEEFQPEHNVFDFDYGLEDSDTVRGFKAEFEDFKNEHSNETQAWRDQYAKESKYKLVEDEEGQKAFRGHLVVACSGSDQDLELAEKITLRMNDEFGKQVYVETRVYNHARQEDNVYEIWLESYDITLLHSRRGAFYNANQWGGPADVDDEQLNNIVERVRHLISDDARYSYHIHEFFTEV